MKPNSQRVPYSPFSPPGDLANSSPSEWTIAQAQRYLTWLTSVTNERISALLAFLGDDGSGDCGELLRRVGSRATWVIQKPEFCHRVSDEIRLTELGYSVAADLGLLVARCLVESCPSIHWEVLRRPKSEVSFNQPVLVGFGKLHLDPVRGSVAEVYRALEKVGDGSAWAVIFMFWRDRAQANTAP
jgi:hypothetical protein